MSRIETFSWTAEFPLQEMFGGAYWGSAIDRFGVQWMWMFSCAAK
jgi:uncharacterized glyoxalase superfamily protein PhnB